MPIYTEIPEALKVVKTCIKITRFISGHLFILVLGEGKN